MAEMEIKKLFYNIAVYANKNWKTCASQYEMFQAVIDWYDAFRIEPNGHDMQTLLDNLKEDVDNGGSDAQKFYDELNKIIGKVEVK